MTRTPSRPPRRWRVAAALIAIGLAASACGDDSPVESPADAAADPDLIEVVAVDFHFEGLPERVPAGTQLTLVNEAPSELHEIVALRLPDDEDRPVDELASLSPEEMGPTLASLEPSMVLLAAPGGEQIAAVGDGTLTEPGRYLLICMIPTGIDPDVYLQAAAESEGGPPQVDGGPPHIVHGMFAELIVE